MAEMKEKRVEIKPSGFKEFHGTPVFISEFTRSVWLWAIIRSYRIIEIAILITLIGGIYLCLK